MKVRVCLVVDINQKEWAKYNAIEPKEVRSDVRETVQLMVEHAFMDLPPSMVQDEDFVELVEA